MIRWKSKLGQAATQAGIVVILIAVLIVFYILFLSPEERAALLGEDASGTGGSSGTTTSRSVLFSVNPGRIYPFTSNTVEHTMPSFMVFTVTNADELKRVPSLYVKNSAFGGKTEEVIFFFDSKTMGDVKLSFNVKKYSGRLIIMLNEYELYEGEITDASPPPISLPADFLKQKNSLVFSVSDTGAAFWRVNEYVLENLLVSAKVTDYSGAFSEQHFSITQREYENFESSTFEFLPDCPPKEEGLVQILINNRAIFTSYPDCGIKTKIEVSPEFLKLGDNALIATTNTGSFLIDMPKLVVKLKETALPVFYFTMPAQLYGAIYSGQRGLLLSLRFADASSQKRGTVEINGFKTYFDTRDLFYQVEIDPESVTIGSNPIKVTPQSDPIDVAELRVDVI